MTSRLGAEGVSVASPAPKPHAAPVGPLSRAFGAVLVGTIRVLPRGLRGAVARALAGLAYALGIRRRITLDNLQRALPELSVERRKAIARGAYRNMALAALESVCVAELATSELDGAVLTHGWQPVEEAIRAGKGVLLATAHFGSWEFLAAVMSRRGVPLHAVVRP